MKCSLIFLFFVIVGVCASLRQQSIAVKGKLLCGNKPLSNTRVKLWEEDSGPDPDDLLDQGYTDSNGEFLLKGDERELTNIDPRLKIYHNCDNSLSLGARKVKFTIPYSYVTAGKEPKKTFDIGIVNMETKFHAVYDINMNFLEVLKTEKPIELININTSKIPTFVLKLWKIVNDTELYRIISWNENGSSILVKQPHAMYKKVLPLYFKHSNLNSFIRQLNMYGFKKTTDIEKISTMNFNNVNVSEFSHKFFLRGRVDLLGNIRRKPSIKKSVHEPLIDSENNNSNFENNKLFNETQNMRSMQSGTENFIDQLTLQNESLKKEIAILHTRHRMQQNAIRKLCDVISEFGYQQPKSKVAISSEPFPTAKNNVTSSNYVDFDYVNMVTKSFNVIP